MSKNEKLCKLLCVNKIDSTQKSLQSALDPKDFSLVTVPDLEYDKLKCKNDPMQHKYMRAMKNVIDSEESILKRDEAKYAEEKIFDLITRYQDQNLSEIESDDDNLQKGNAAKKDKKKKKSGKKKGKASGKKKKKTKSAKKK